VGKAAAFAFMFLCADLASAAEWRHGLSFFGDLKYPPGFNHLEYVNPDAPRGGTIKMPQLGNFDNLNFFLRKGRQPSGMSYSSSLIYDRLMFNVDDEPSSQYGWLASEVMLADDYSWVEFRLRDEARWHDGKPVTAEDVVFTFERIKEDGSPVLKLEFLQVVNAEVINEKQVKFYFRGARSPKPAQTVANMYVLPAHYWRDRVFDQTTLEIPLGSGPYRIAEVDPGRKIVYERVDDYWGRDVPVMKGRFNFQRVVYDYFSDENVIHEAHKAGIVDVVLEGVAKRWATGYDFPGTEQGYFVKDLIKTERPFGMVFGVLFNLRLPKFQDVRVREALALAYDFEWSNRVLYHGFYDRVDSFFENSDLAQSGLPSPAELELLEPFRGQVPDRVFTAEYEPSRTSGYGHARGNLLKAARLLKEAGYEVRDGALVDGRTGEPFTIEFVTVSVYLERSLMPFLNALERLGIDTSIRTVEVSQYINRLGKFDFEGGIRTYSQTLTPGTELRSYWGSGAANKQYSRNTAGISDPVVDHLIEEIIRSRSREQMIAATRALDRVMLWNFYLIPGYYPPGYRYGYWDKFGKPKIQAKYRTGFFDTWWYSEEKAARVEEGMQRFASGGTR
jgi:microcin C transport system substrate-binding protein